MQDFNEPGEGWWTGTLNGASGIFPANHLQLGPVAAKAIAACEARGEWVRAVQLLQEMEEAGCAPSVVAYSSAISACAKGGAWQRAVCQR